MSAKSRGLVHADIEDFIAKLEGHQDISELLKYFRFFSIRAMAEEFVAGEVPGQTNPRGYDDIRQRPGAVKPLIYVVTYIC
jgi:hypothetical protein